jgi:hypothetical protein
MTNVAKSREDNCKHQKPGGKENEHIGWLSGCLVINRIGYYSIERSGRYW